MNEAFWRVASPETLAALIRDIDGAGERMTVAAAALRCEAWRALVANVGEVEAAAMVSGKARRRGKAGV